MSGKRGSIAEWKSWFLPISQFGEFPKYLVIVALAYLPALWLYSVPLTGDQKVYIATALEMLWRGEWRYPILFNQLSFIKPPMHAWFTLSSWKVFGFNLFGTLLPSVLALMGTCVFLDLISKRLDVRRPLGGMFFAGTIGAVTFGTTAQMEIYLVLFFTGAWWAAIKGLQDKRWGYVTLAFVLAGLSGLLKSPLYPVLWVCSFAMYLAIMDRRKFLNWRIWTALLAGVVVGSAWYLFVYFTEWEKFFHDFLMRETWFKRSGNSLSWSGLWFSFLVWCLPFAAMLYAAVVFLFQKKSRPVAILFLCWVAIPWVFFTWFPYRVGTYLFLVLPAFFFAMDYAFSKNAPGLKFLMQVTAMLMSVVLGVSVLAVILGRDFFTWPVGIVWTGLLVSGVAVVWNGVTVVPRAFAASLLGFILVFRLAGILIGEEDIADFKRLARENPDRPLVFYSRHNHVWHEFGLLAAAAGRKDVNRTERIDELAEMLRDGGVVLINDEDLKNVYPKIVRRFQAGELEESSWWRWPRKKNLRLSEIFESGRIPRREYRILKKRS